MESIRTPVFVLNSNLQILYANASARTTFSSQLQMQNSAFAAILPNFSKVNLEDCINETQKIQIADSEFKLQCNTIPLSVFHTGYTIILYNGSDNEGSKEIFDDGSAELSQLVEQHTKELTTVNENLRIELERRLQIESQLVHESVHDDLTNIGNRKQLNISLKREFADYQRNPERNFCLLYIDFDGFKKINDTYGHDIGDLFLIAVAQKLKNCMRETDLVCRIGGDEFVVLLTDIDSPKTAELAVERIYKEVSRELVIEHNTFTPSLSVGMAFAEHGKDPEELLKNADLAMYKAKSLGKNQYLAFNESMKLQQVQQNQFNLDLATALKKNTIQLQFQPIFDRNGKIHGWETGAIWNYDSLGTLDYSEISKMITNMQQLYAFEQYMLSRASEIVSTVVPGQAKDSRLFFTVQISPNNISTPQFQKTVQNLHKKAKKADIVLTISNIPGTTNTDALAQSLQELNTYKMSLALNSFGDLPLPILNHVAFIKVAPDITQTVSRTTQGSFIDGIVSLGKHLGKKILFDGVRSKLQADRIWKAGADFCQGQFFGETISLSELRKYFKQKNN